mmetsp:Transcript_11495/g.53435  ORF Transcript_11495/g.53435 Transcript_11495/m.53435 type:complete len:204 (-) Transcript_11495:2625-3236(-)
MGIQGCVEPSDRVQSVAFSRNEPSRVGQTQFVEHTCPPGGGSDEGDERCPHGTLQDDVQGAGPLGQGGVRVSSNRGDVLGVLRDPVRRRIRARRDEEQGDGDLGPAGHRDNAQPRPRRGDVRQIGELAGARGAQSRLHDRRAISRGCRADVRPRRDPDADPGARRRMRQAGRTSPLERQMHVPRRHQPLVQQDALRTRGRRSG